MYFADDAHVLDKKGAIHLLGELILNEIIIRRSHNDP